MSLPGRKFHLEIHPNIPAPLQRLQELANNLWYSWDQDTRRLFRWLDDDLWRCSGHNPKLFLRSINQQRLQSAAQDQVFMDRYKQVLSAYDSYHGEKSRRENARQFKDDDLVAYFCAEYGLHESLKVYSGGLGILAGDHCKTASDLRMPFIAVGLLYTQGYFTQTIDNTGNQIATYFNGYPENLPVNEVKDANGNRLTVEVELDGRSVTVCLWTTQVGHISICLLDTNVPENSGEDREITYKLYGGGDSMRIRQEIILGVGGVRALRKLGLSPTVWHINEGHAGFLIPERIRELVAGGVDFSTALESVAANTVFTTHTPVSAGHDHFPQDMVAGHLHSLIGQLGIPREQFMDLGRLSPSQSDFNMTTLAITGSRYINGVSRIHGEVSANICAGNWPQTPPPENPVRFITNGVHIPTFMMPDWALLFDRFLGAEWRNRVTDREFWKRVHGIPDHLFWSVKQSVKSQMLEVLRNTLIAQHQRNQVSGVNLDRILQYIDPNNPNVLTIGFARRFATYKRATLLFNDVERLRHLLRDEQRPVVFIFAGKAHPADKPGQELLRAIHRFSQEDDFIGHVLLVEGYDIGLARRLVSGVDVWLNTPVYPLEASGTSGMKAALNGTVNLSVLDGWWAEAYTSDNGWGVNPLPHDEMRRDNEDTHTLHELLQNEVVPLYYRRGKFGYSTDWVKKAKYSMADILPRFNTVRMLNEYIANLYLPASLHGRQLAQNNRGNAAVLAQWKQKIRKAWPGVRIRELQTAEGNHNYGTQVQIKMAVLLNGLATEDVVVEMLLQRQLDQIANDADGEPGPCESPCSGGTSHYFRFAPEQAMEGGEYLFSLNFQPEWCGCLSYRVRLYPAHALLAHTHEMGLMTWL